MPFVGRVSYLQTRTKGSHCSGNPLFLNIFAESCKIVNPKLFQLHSSSSFSAAPSNHPPLFLRAPPPLMLLSVPPSTRSLSALCKRKYSIRMLNSITAFLINPKYPFPNERRLLSNLSLSLSLLLSLILSLSLSLFSRTSSNELDLFRLSPSLSWITVANDMTPLKSADLDPTAVDSEPTRRSRLSLLGRNYRVSREETACHW